MLRMTAQAVQARAAGGGADAAGVWRERSLARLPCLAAIGNLQGACSTSCHSRLLRPTPPPWPGSAHHVDLGLPASPPPPGPRSPALPDPPSSPLPVPAAPDEVERTRAALTALAQRAQQVRHAAGGSLAGSGGSSSCLTALAAAGGGAGQGQQQVSGAGGSGLASPASQQVSSGPCHASGGMRRTLCCPPPPGGLHPHEHGRRRTCPLTLAPCPRLLLPRSKRA
jgi:hypothetical protein